jgi:predicted enzyme related to lactoylglutathione lyase
MTQPDIAFMLYPVRDLARARAFYEQTFGLTPQRSFGDHREGLVQYTLGHHSLILTTALPLQAGPAGGMMVFEVGDVDAALARLRAQHPPPAIEMVDTPIGRLVTFHDPDGNRVAIHQREPDLTGPAIEDQ